MLAYKNVFTLVIIIFLCSNPISARYFQFDSQTFLKNHKIIFQDSFPTDVKRLNLSQDVVFTNCDSKEARCSENKEKVQVMTEAYSRGEEVSDDYVVYNYKVSAGEIIGKGKKVVWDLSNVEPGEYTITAGVDDGCGVCGETKTRTVYIIECPKNLSIGYPPGGVTSINTDQDEVFEVCQINSKKKIVSCSDERHFIKVSTISIVEDENKAIFKYDVTGGRIIGNGANVEWDLSEAEPGTYVVTASVDVGMGFCSTSKSTIVKVVECKRCKKQK